MENKTGEVDPAGGVPCPEKPQQQGNIGNSHGIGSTPANNESTDKTISTGTASRKDGHATITGFEIKTED